MKPRRVITAVLALALVSAASGYAQQTAEDLYQAGLYQEEVQGNLESAIDIYERILQDFPNNRPVAAKALMHIGLCHEKLGSREAQRAYERLLRDYADQTEMVTRARTRLAALRRPLEAAEDSTIVVRRVWAGRLPFPSGIDFSGGPSPDGRHLAHIDWSSGNVAVRDLIAGESRQVTHDGTWLSPIQYPLNATVSPDGAFVAYSWVVEDSVVELRVAELDGSEPRVLYSVPESEAYPSSWSTDGRHIAFCKCNLEEKTTEIAWISVEDGLIQSLKAIPGTHRWMTLAHSPDDRFIAIALPVEGDTSDYDISLLATDGSGELSLVEHPAKDHVLGWLPGTGQLLFLSDRSGNWDAWAVQVAEGEVRGEPRPVRRALGDVEPMGFTQDGSLFYYIYTLRYITSIAPFDEATGQIQTGASEPLLGSTDKPAWSPSGEYLALIRGNVLRVRNVTTDEERVVGRHLSPLLLSWFPDGRSILVLGIERGGVWEAADESPPAIYRVDVASGETMLLIEFPPNASWQSGIGALATSDGEGVIYINEGRLALRHLSSGREVELYRHPDLASRVLALSPDSEHLVFGIADSTVDRHRPHVDLGEGGRLMVMPSRGGEIRELVKLDAPCAVYSVAWTSDGEHVLYHRRDQDGTALFRVPRRGGEPERVWETEQTIFMLALSPDGRRVAYITRENEAEIWVMENLVAALSEQQ